MPTLLKNQLESILENFKSTKEDYPYFVETGTYEGETILRFVDEFKKVYTIELSKEFFDRFNKKEFDRNKLISLLGDSSHVIKEVISELDNSTIFWLDGHYSSGNTAKGNKDVPLFEELKCINDYFEYDSLIIIDDLRLFGTHMSEDWSDITKEKLLEVLSNRVVDTLEENDRFIIRIKKITNE